MSIYGYLKRITNTALAILLAAGTLFCAAACQTDPPSLATVASNTSLTVTPSKTTTTATNSTTTARASKTTRQTTATTRPLEVLKHGDVMWEELPFQKSKTGFWDQTDTWFDLRREITHAEYVFSGKVISCREYVSSRSQKYETVPDWEKKVIIEVKIDQVYHGNPPGKGGIIKIYYEGQIRSPLAHSAVILEQKDYVFVTQSLGYYAEKYPEVAAFTDVYLDTYYKFSVFPIENGDVLAYTGYFDWNSELMKKVKPQRKTDLIAHGTTGGYAVMAEKDFEEAFLSLFKNPETLPTAPNFWEPPPETTRSTDISQKRSKRIMLRFSSEGTPTAVNTKTCRQARCSSAASSAHTATLRCCSSTKAVCFTRKRYPMPPWTASPSVFRTLNNCWYTKRGILIPSTALLSGVGSTARI
ncbi:MAG: hypothetical protein ACOYJY_04530 [Acutalibacteraceae bacterium]|jgi:hypothetical protein